MNLDAYRRIMAGEALTYVLASQALWRLSGPDSTRYLNGQVTNDIARLAENQGCYASICSAKGRMEGDLFIARHAEAWYLDAAPVLHENLGLRLEKYLIADDAAFEDIGETWSLSHVFGSDAPAAPEGGFVIPRSRYGVPGHDIWNPTPAAAIVGATVEKDVVEAIRLEHGIPEWDAELTPTTLPPEGGPHMLAAISYTKGCYVGQEVIARLKSVGHVNRTLVFFRSRSESFPAPATKLHQGEREVGSITSAGFSPALKCGVALGYVQRTVAAEGTVLTAGDLELTIGAPLSPS